VPFTFGGEELDFCRALSGVAAPCVAQCGETKFNENFLFTHRGLSGPAMLQISSYWQAPQEILINLFPDDDARDWLETNRTSGKRLDTLLATRLPERFVLALASRLGAVKALRAYSSAELDDIARKLKSWTLRPAGTEGYATAEVTVGGVDTRGLSSKTMEARSGPGLHFIGEAVDVTGWLGGYNFQWAWASGHACGQVI
jgi:predicted Rossmann fold flavoprotein